MKAGAVLKKKKLLWKLFVSTLYLSTFTFRGGYVIVTLMKKKFVDDYHWIEEPEMLDLIAIAQSSPGAIAVNGAIVVGYKLAGLVGAMTAIAGTVLPPFLILSILSVFYSVFQSNFFVIASVVFDMGSGIVKEKDPLSLVIMAGAFLATCVFDVNVIYVVIASGLIGALRTWIRGRREKA